MEESKRWTLEDGGKEKTPHDLSRALLRSFVNGMLPLAVPISDIARRFDKTSTEIEEALHKACRNMIIYEIHTRRVKLKKWKENGHGGIRIIDSISIRDKHTEGQLTVKLVDTKSLVPPYVLNKLLSDD